MTATTKIRRGVLLGLAAFAMVWAIVRAHLQAITIDEALTYTNFVRPVPPEFWTAHANNHVLNSMLMWGFTRAFGTSNLAARSGALIGAAIYITASYLLCVLIADRFLLRVSLFICLVFNPFIFDFLVAARGYGLASGFLLSAICFVAYALVPDAKSPRVTRACVAASLCIALSFLGNFSFAFVDAACIVMLYLWASAGEPLKSAKGAAHPTGNEDLIAPRSVLRESMKKRGVLAAACFLPGLLLAGAVAGPIVLQWERAELNYGTTSLGDAFTSLYESSFYEVHPSALNQILSEIPIPCILLLMFSVFAVWRASLVLIHWRSPRTARSAWFQVLATVPIVAVVATLVINWALFHFLRIPLPRNRTGIYLVVLTTLFLGILAAVPIATRAGEIARRGMTILMVVLGSYFLLCLRSGYFKEWKWDSDTDKLYSALASYDRACGLKDIAVNWRFDAALNYYRHAAGRETLPDFPHADDLVPGKQTYVLYEPEDHDFLVSHSLNVVYRTSSGAIIALNPAFVPSPGESQCPVKPLAPGN